MSALPGTCVVDASVAVKLFLEEEGTEEMRRFFAQSLAQSTPGLLVPDLFFAECANVMWKRVRRGDYPGRRAASSRSRPRPCRLLGADRFGAF